MKIEELKKRKVGEIDYTNDSLPLIIARIYHEFISQRSSYDIMCQYEDMFKRKSIPYDRKNFQQYYLLKYCVAYAFEYHQMYSMVLEDMKQNGLEPIRVDSIGCGSMIDAWSLNLACADKDFGKNYDYTGIDVCEWHYKFADSSKFVKCNAADYYANRRDIDSNIFMFPRSISEFSDRDFNSILRSFSNKKITSDNIYLLVSKRRKIAESSSDKFRIDQLDNALHTQGFTFAWYEKENDEFADDKLKFYNVDSRFSFPTSFIEKFVSLNTLCTKYDTALCDIKKCPIEGKYPMLKTKNICFEVIKYERNAR